MKVIIVTPDDSLSDAEIEHMAQGIRDLLRVGTLDTHDAPPAYVEIRRLIDHFSALE